MDEIMTIDDGILKEVLTDYAKWQLEQGMVDNRFYNGELTKYEWWMSTIELLQEHRPLKDSSVKSLRYA